MASRPQATTTVVITEDELLTDAAIATEKSDVIATKSVSDQRPAAAVKDVDGEAEQSAVKETSSSTTETKSEVTPSPVAKSSDVSQASIRPDGIAAPHTQSASQSVSDPSVADQSPAGVSSPSSSKSADEAKSETAQTGETDNSNALQAEETEIGTSVISAEADPSQTDDSIASETAADPDSSASDVKHDEVTVSARPSAAAAMPDKSAVTPGQTAEEELAPASQPTGKEEVLQSRASVAKPSAIGTDAQNSRIVEAAPLNTANAGDSADTTEVAEAGQPAAQSVGPAAQQATAENSAGDQQVIAAQQAQTANSAQSPQFDIAMALPVLPSLTMQQQIRNFVTSYDGGRCFFAVPVALDQSKPRIEGFGVSLNAIADFSSRLHNSIDIRADVTARMITMPQCAAAEFLKTRLQQHFVDLVIRVDREQIDNGARLSGEIEGLKQAYLSLVIIDDDGHVSNLSKYVKRTDTDTTFSAPIQLQGEAHKRNQILVALASDANLPSLQPLLQSRDSDVLFRSLEEQARKEGVDLAIGVAVFQVN